MKPIVISLCDRSANAIADWSDAGYECWALDIYHDTGVGPLSGGIRLIGGDVRTFKLPTHREIAFMFAFPPCTHLAVSGARWFKGKGLRLLAEAIDIVASCAELCEQAGCPYLIENPVSTLSTYWRKPDYKFDPCDYAGYLNDPGTDMYTKCTCLWTGGGFIMPPPIKEEPLYGSLMHMMPPSPDRDYLRSVTPRGFARAVFEYNEPSRKAGRTS
jgi:hypothetical protein